MKDTLVAYTIAVIQNTQTLQFEQMQVVLQNAQNHASIETLLKAEHLMTTHFNLAILTDNTASNRAVNALTTETGVTDPGPSTFVSEETICKAPHINSHTTKCDKPAQPTGVVFPTYRGEPGRLAESWQVTNLIILGIFLMLASKTAHTDTT